MTGRPPAGTKDVKITDSTGIAVEDINEFAGRPREQTVYNGAARCQQEHHRLLPRRADRHHDAAVGHADLALLGQKQVTQYRPTAPAR